jgi:hypothetical protein
MAASLPEHSPLGGSAAERFMNCSGYTGLTDILRSRGLLYDADPEYRRDGVLAHKLGADCLTSGQDAWLMRTQPEFKDVDDDIEKGAQVYINYVRSLGDGKLVIEYKMHNPELHPQMFSTLDCAHEPPLVGPSEWEAEIIDYKNGAGVVVEVEQNAQLMYYANQYVATRLKTGRDFCDVDKIKLTIVQPNADHPEGVIRSWIISVGELKAWLYNELLPAMERTHTDHYFSVGEWCRFCPAKLACPVFIELNRKAKTMNLDPVTGLVDLPFITYADANALKMVIKAAEERELHNLLNGKPSTGGKLVLGKVNRVFKPEAPVEQTFGILAYATPKLLGPKGIEDLPGGENFVKEWAYKPNAGYVVAPIADKRGEVKANSNVVDVFSAAVQRHLAQQEGAGQ